MWNMLPGMATSRNSDAQLDSRKLMYFLAVVDYGGFGRAAEHLLIAQPSLSQAIAALEKTLDVALFHRVGRQAVLSEAGKALIGPARVVVRDLEAAGAAARAIHGVQVGVLDIVSMPSPGIEPLTTLVADFAGSYPEVRIDVSAAFVPGDVVEAISSGAAEIGIVGSPQPVHAPRLLSIELEQQPLILVVNPESGDFQSRTTIASSELGGTRLIESQRGSLMRRFVDDVSGQGSEVVIVAEVAHRTSVLPLVLAGVGHAVLPSAWGPLARRSGLRTLGIDGAPKLDVALLARDRDLTPPARKFVEIAGRYKTRL